MRVITSIQAASGIGRPVCLSIGTFDGLHRGHAEILRWTVRTARKNRCQAWALTFSNHPLEILKGNGPARLTTTEEKLGLFERLGLDGVLLLKFDRKLSRLTGREFIGLLCGRIRLSAVCVGGNFLFGRSNRAGGGLLAAMARQNGFKLKIYPVLRDRATDSVISSSSIRALLAQGRIGTANRLIGRPYSLTSVVVKGRKLGRKLGFPTLNFDPRDASLAEKQIPRPGVYVTEAVVAGTVRRGLTFIGRNFGRSRLAVETHLPGWSGTAYGRKVTVRFLRYLRPPRTFRTLEGLRKRIGQDIINARRL